MFFVKLESTSNAFSPSYIRLDASQDEAIKQYNGVFKPFLTGSANAVLKVSLLQSEEMGKETIMREMLCRVVTLPTEWESSYTHPFDYTIWHKDGEPYPEGLIAELEKLAIWEPMSFPNGSNYYQQKLPRGTFILSSFGEVVLGPGSVIRIGWDVWPLNRDYVNVGGGVDLGIHFNTVDKGLALFIK